MIRKVCVIGAGTLGNGIAQVSTQAGYRTSLVDVDNVALERAMKSIRAGLDKFVRKGRYQQSDIDAMLDRITISTDLAAQASDADYVIEAVFERIEIKLDVFRKLDAICPPHAILSSNTSGLPIGLIGSVTGRPGQIIGMHFMYPVPVMPAIEVIKTLLTSEDTVRQSIEFAHSIGKEAIVVKDSPGFVLNRVLALVINEAAKMLEEGLAGIEDIDKMMKLGLSWPIGPLELVDITGIDVAVDTLEGIYRQTGWERYKPARILNRMVEIGYTGRKAGKGLYTLYANLK
ncbi:MAG: 3-hydroxyacyl-CoA dehydrogenase family protein [Dehalococcoidia bacterium]|nr:3-hydroxyacyl-CoA dehydrogenase family protein [Dehalococcoidia bacterium]